MHNAPRTAEKIGIQFFKLALSAYYLLGTSQALGSASAGSEKHRRCYREELFPQVAGGCLLGIKRTDFSSTSTTRDR